MVISYEIYETSQCKIMLAYNRFKLNFIHHRCCDGDIMVILCPGFRLAAGKKDRFLYVFDRAGSQPAP